MADEKEILEHYFGPSGSEEERDRVADWLDAAALDEARALCQKRAMKLRRAANLLRTKRARPMGIVSFLRGHMDSYAPGSIEREKMREFAEWAAGFPLEPEDENQ